MDHDPRYLTPAQLGRRLYWLRQEEGCTRQELAAATELSLERLEALERGLTSLTALELGVLGEHYHLVSGQLIESAPLDSTMRPQPGDSEAVLFSKHEFRECINDFFGIEALVGDGKPRQRAAV
jgi:transcriptional regulator with XRE-family HTH domain